MQLLRTHCRPSAIMIHQLMMVYSAFSTMTSCGTSRVCAALARIAATCHERLNAVQITEYPVRSFIGSLDCRA